MQASVRAARRWPASALFVITMSSVIVSLSPAAPAGAAVGSADRQMASYINEARAARGLRPLAIVSSLSDVARAHSRAMVRAGRLFHTEDLPAAIDRYAWDVAGEDVGLSGSLDELFDAFMESSPHRFNILYRGFDRVGVGVVWSDSIAFATIMFLG